MALFLYLLMLLVSSATACDRCVHQSKATFFTTASALQSGACGYGSMALGFNGGYLAAAVASIYDQGGGCGDCFQIRCKNRGICSEKGTEVIVTDVHGNTQTDFILSAKAFRAMARQGMDNDISKLGIIDVEYKRVPCDYKNKNLAVYVEKFSKKPNYLAIKYLYQGGQAEIIGTDVAPVGTAEWHFMIGNYGAVWDTDRAPSGALEFRISVTSGNHWKYYYPKNVLPADWKPGMIYSTNMQLTDIAQEHCSPCDYSTWS